MQPSRGTRRRGRRRRPSPHIPHHLLLEPQQTVSVDLSLSSFPNRPSRGLHPRSPLRRSPSPCRDACPDRAPPCCGPLRRGCRSALGAPHAPGARRGRWRGMLGGAAGGVAPKGRVHCLSALSRTMGLLGRHLAPDRLYDGLSGPRLASLEYAKSRDCVKSNVIVCHLSPHSAIIAQNW
jgi:hypothetical protein